jgi:hypothetical protein
MIHFAVPRVLCYQKNISKLCPLVYFIHSAEKGYIAGRFFFKIVVKLKIALIYAGFEDLTAVVMNALQ